MRSICFIMLAQIASTARAFVCNFKISFDKSIGPPEANPISQHDFRDGDKFRSSAKAEPISVTENCITAIYCIELLALLSTLTTHFALKQNHNV